MSLSNCIVALSQISVTLSAEKSEFEICWLGCFRAPDTVFLLRTPSLS